jgi:hypothetical protein
VSEIMEAGSWHGSLDCVSEGVRMYAKREPSKGEENMVDNRDGSWPTGFGCVKPDQIALHVHRAKAS